MRERTPEARLGRTPAVPPNMQLVLSASDGLLGLLPVATCVCDLDGRIVQFNERAVEIWGRRPRPGETHAEFTAENKFYSIDGRALHQSKLAQVLETGRPATDKCRLATPEGTGRARMREYGSCRAAGPLCATMREVSALNVR